MRPTRPRWIDRLKAFFRPAPRPVDKVLHVCEYRRQFERSVMFAEQVTLCGAPVTTFSIGINDFDRATVALGATFRLCKGCLAERDRRAALRFVSPDALEP